MAAASHDDRPAPVRRRSRLGLLGLAIVAASVSLVPAFVPAVAEDTRRGAKRPAGLTAPGAEGSAADVVFNGESGGLTGATTSARAAVTEAAARRGRRGLRLAANRQAAFVRWDTDEVPQGHAHASLRLWVRVIGRGAWQSLDVVTVGNTQQSANFDLFVSGTTGRFQWDLFREDTDQSSFAVVRNRWYRVEAQVDFGGTHHTATVRINGVGQGTITSRGRDTRVRTLSVGSWDPKTHRQHYDDIALAVGDQPLGWFPALSR